MKKMMNKRILALALSVVMVLGMLPMSVFSVDAGEYDLWVGGEQVNSANASDVFGDGMVSYDPANNVLTLINYTYEGTGYSWGEDYWTSYAAIYYGGDGTLTVAVEGASYLENTADGGCGIFAAKGLTVSGSGTLHITTTGWGGCGIYVDSGDVTVENGSEAVITTTGGGGCGIYVDSGDVTVENGSEAVITTTGWGSDGIYAQNGSVAVAGTATVTAAGEEAHGIYAQNGSVAVTGTATITVGEMGRAIYARDHVTVSDGSVTAEMGTIRAETGDVTISGSRVTLKKSQISAEGDVNISGSCVTAENSPISAGGDVNISDSTVNTDGAGTAIEAWGNVTVSGSARVSITNVFLMGIYAQSGSVTIRDDAKVYITVTHDGISSVGMTVSDSAELYVKGGTGAIKSKTELSLGAELSIHLPSGGTAAKSGDYYTVVESDGSTLAKEVLIARVCAHSFATGWSYDATHHWHACENGCVANEFPELFAGVEGSGYEAHSSSCSTCGYGSVTTDLYVGGMALPDGYYLTESGTVTTVQPRDGYAHYADGTLTLCNYDYTGAGYSDAAVFYSDYSKPLKLVLEGVNSVTRNSSSTPSNSYGVRANGGLEVSGDGSLIANAGAATSSSYGIHTYNSLKLAGGSLTGIGGTANSYSYGLWVSSLISVTGGSLTGEGSAASSGSSYGAWSSGDISVTDGSLTGKSGAANNVSQGVASGGENGIAVAGTGRVTGSSGNAGSSSGGVWSSLGGITVSGSSCLEGTGGTVSNAGGRSYGVYARGGIGVSDTGKVTGTGGTVTNIGGTSYGVSADDSVCVSGAGYLNGNAGDAAVSSSGNSYGVFISADVQVFDNGCLEGVGGEATNTSQGVHVEFATASIEVYGNGCLAGVGGEVGNSNDVSSVGVSVSGSENSVGIKVYESGSLTGIGGKAVGNFVGRSYGVQTKGLEVYGNGTLEGIGGLAQGGETAGVGDSCGVLAANIAVSGGRLTGWGGQAEGYDSCSYGVYLLGDASNSIAVSGGVTEARGDTGAFTKQPAIVPEAIEDTRIWSGDDEDAYTGEGMTVAEAGDLYYTQKYVRIELKGYDLWVGGVQVTAANAGDVFGDGKVKYELDTNTLTFSDYTCSGQGYNGSAIWYGGDGTLILDGKVTVDTTGSHLFGVVAENANVTVSGEVVIRSENIGLSAENGDVTVSGRLDIHSNNGIYGNGGVKITGTVNIKTSNIGIFTGGDVIVSNGKVTVTGTDEHTVGIDADELIVSGSDSAVEISVDHAAIRALVGITLKDGIAVLEPCVGTVAQHTVSDQDFSLTYYTVAANGTPAKTVKLANGVPAHSGGTATCKDKAVCSVCGQGYGELAAHSFQNGKCTVCGAAEADSTNPKTGDDSLMLLWAALLPVSGGTLAVLTAADRRRRLAAHR